MLRVRTYSLSPSFSPRRILIVRLSSLGDILFCLPAYAALRRRFPEAFFGWVVEDRFAPLLDSIGGLNALHIVPRQQWVKRPGSVRAEPFAAHTRRERLSCASPTGKVGGQG